MFPKKIKKKDDTESSNSSEGLMKAALPRTIYFMNVKELRQTALLYLPKRTGPIEEGKQDERQSVSISLHAGEEGSSDREMKITRNGEDEASSKSSEDNSLDELFLQNSARKPPPKICRRSTVCSPEGFSNSSEMDECTLLSSGPTPVKRSCQGIEENDSKFSILPYHLSSPLSPDAGCRDDDVARGSETSATMRSSVSKRKPDMSFLDDIF